MFTGTIKFFDSKNKFGFIVADETGEEVYFHAKELKEPVNSGDKVRFDTIPRKRGKAAIKVEKQPA